MQMLQNVHHLRLLNAHFLKLDKGLQQTVRPQELGRCMNSASAAQQHNTNSLLPYLLSCHIPCCSDEQLPSLVA